MIDFSVVEQTIEQTKAEVAEHEAAAATLEAVKAEASAVQLAAVEANAKVAAAADAANVQKADVVTGITYAIAALNDLLLQLQ